MRTRKTNRLTTAFTAFFLSATATARAQPAIEAQPKRLDSGEIQTVTGLRWPLIAFCSRTVRASVRSAQNAVTIAQRNRNVGPGRRRLVARMRCESGDDGSPVILRRSTLIRVRP